jgi:cell wall-associated NlpC family hydrolase
MSAYDPRVTPARPDLAAKRLEGKVQSARFVEGVLREVTAPQAPMRKAPSHDAALETEALKGEYIVIYDDNGEGWSWGQLQSDDYVGWIPSRALGPKGQEPTHHVSALRTLVFPGPSIKLPPVESLPLESKLAIARFEQEFAVSAAGGYLAARHLSPINAWELDFVAVAERFVGTPYLWGGKTNAGIDCSGLVQIALSAAGLKCPRDSDMQERTLGQPLVPADDVSSLRRGDLIFWTGHVAIACDAARIVHANAFHMSVAVEPVADALRRIGAAGVALKSIRRMEGLDLRKIRT